MAMALGKKALLAAGLLLFSGAAGASERNVLLITVDTLRADRLGCYASGRATPAIDALAAKGVLFERAFAHNPTTLPSHANILSGMTPLFHGVSGNSKSKFPPDCPTMAGDLKALGYATGAFIGAFPLDSRFGLDRDFDVYDDAFPAAAALEGAFKERRASDVVKAAADWISRQPGKWFCWVHLWDPHAPYAPPEPFLNEFREDPYSGEVAYVDSQLGALFAYNSTLHVPLIIAGPGIAPRRVAAGVGHIDILPTVCDLLGIKPRPALQGESLVALMKTGRTEDRSIYFESLEPYLDKGCAPLRGFIRGGRKFIDTPIPEVYDLGNDFGESKNLASKSDLAKLRKELDRIKKAESSPLAERGARVADGQTLERLRSLGYAATPVVQPKASYGPAEDVKSLLPFQQRLERAILLADGGQPEDGIRELAALVRDRRDFTPAYVYLSQTLVARGRADEAVRTLDEGVRANPGNYALLSAFGTLLVMSRQDDRAEEILQKAIAVIDFDPDAWNNLGGIRMRKGDFEKALECFDRAVSLDGGFFPAHMNIGAARMAMYLNQGRDPDNLTSAVESFRRAVSLDPGSNAALRGLAGASMTAGKVDEAIAAWEKAIAADPKDGFSTLNLGRAYLGRGDKARALRCFETYLDLKKDSLTAEEKSRVLDLIARCREAQAKPANLDK
jgi:arylsulfatase A-like enzyme/Flp pilus assembly protein TadD